MLEVLIWSLFVGSLGIDAVLVSGWLRWQQKVVKTQNKEEEQILRNDETQGKLTGEKVSGATSVREAKVPPNGESPNRLNRVKISSSARPDRSRTKSSRPLPQPAAKKNPGTQGKPSELARSLPPLAPPYQGGVGGVLRSQPQTVLNPSLFVPSHLAPESLTPTQNVVNSFNYLETIQQPIYFTESQAIEWEYKIVRANYDLFRNYTDFMRLCEEESQAGWILLEKLDDRRVRFKRSIAMRDKVDVNQLSFDPYRCHYGPSNGWLNFVGAIAAVTAMVLPAYLGYSLVSHTLQESTTKNSQTQAPSELLNPDFQPPQIP